MHTCFCDGKSTPEEMVLSAIEMGLECIGFSGHSYTPDNEETEVGMSDEVFTLYKKEIHRLRDMYADKIRILCGIEMDYYSENDTSGFDYIIGAVHEIRVGDNRIVVDWKAEDQRYSIDTFFGGDPMDFAECYFETVADVVRKTECDIIGHFDLLTKFCEKDRVFDTQDPRYIRAWKSAADRLLRYGIPFEINTGAMSRGWRTTPYPAPDIVEYIKDHGGRFIFSSDSHDRKTICYKFDELERLYSEQFKDLAVVTEI